MGRWTVSYRGHLLAFHGGDLPGLSLAVLDDADRQHWRDRVCHRRSESARCITQSPTMSTRGCWVWILLRGARGILLTVTRARRLAKRGGARPVRTGLRAPDLRISLADYAGEFEHPAYGIMKINLKEKDFLQFDFHNIVLPLAHYHYDRFDTPNDEEYGLWSLNFMTNPAGEVSSLVVSVDEGQVTFTRRADPGLSDPAVLQAYEGKYLMGGATFSVEVTGNEIFIVVPGTPRLKLIPVSKDVFRLEQFADYSIIFVRENGVVTGLKAERPVRRILGNEEIVDMLTIYRLW